MASIVILTGNHLCHNPRVLKEATALRDAGHFVQVLGAWIDPFLNARDLELLAQVSLTFVPVVDLAQTDARTKARRFACRVRTKLGALAFQYLGIENRWQLGYAAGALECAARRSNADLFIAHSESALWAISQLRAPRSKPLSAPPSVLCPPLSGSPLSARCTPLLGVDLEDWFSEDLLPEARRQRPVKLLRNLEQGALKHSAHSTCTSHAMADALAKEFDCRPPEVIYNAFPWSDRQTLDGQFKDRGQRRVPSIHWYSQTLGHGRGLEDLFAALPHLKHEVEIHLRGRAVAGFDAWLEGQVPPAWRTRVFVQDLVSNNELLSRIAEHDIGFAGEMKYSRSRDLTVTNKILHYLLGGLAVVASDTAGQREVADQANGGVFLYPSGDTQALAGQLNELLGSPERLAAGKAAALRAAKQTFCWERMAPRLVRSVSRSLPVSVANNLAELQKV